MKITANLKSSFNKNEIVLKTNENIHSIFIQPKQTGFGSSANGGEILFLALATCYCNDIYREAEIRKIKVNSLEVEVIGEFGVEGESAKNISYSAKINADGSEPEILQLMIHTDTVAEIQNTLRKINEVKLDNIEIIRSV